MAPAARPERPQSDEPPLARARWLLASVLATASIGGMTVSLLGGGRLGAEPASTTLVRARPVDDAASIVRLIDVNSAPPESLEMLPGIGPVLARRIADDRQTNGPFKNLDDLDRVKGIGPRTIDKLRPLARAGEP